jgi:MFS family permease
VAAAVYGLSGSFQWPVYMAAITTMVPKKHLGRANGMMMLVDSGPGVFSPILAGLLLPVIGLTGILTVDAIALSIPAVRDVETILPDHDQLEKAPGGGEAG